MRTKRILMSILLLLVTFSLVACGKVTVKVSGDTQVKVGQTINLTPEASKKGATFSWASSNDAVATVKDGAVTGVSAGKVTITVTATSGKKTGEASLEVTVIADNKPVISGADDTQVLKGVKFAPLDGVTARDEEDGDLTTQIQVEGSVNYNVVGTYTVTYTVKDKDNNVTTVTRTVTVVANDTDAPLLTGTSPKTIVVGDAQFNPLENVSANDAIDGDVTASIQVTGEVNVWKLGDYQIKYEVSDAAGNKAEATRTITVGLGEFQFEELADKEFTKVENDYQFAVALEEINTQISAFALAKLTFKVNAAAACELTPSITNGAAQAKIALAAGENEITIYLRVNSAIVEGNVKLAAPADASLTFSDVKFAFAEAKDVTAPVISVPEGKLVLPADVADLNVLKGFILNGVTAQDNVDMVMNSKLDVDMTGIAAGTYEEKQVTIFAVDTAGNRGEATRTVEFAKAYSTNLITDPTFSTDSRYTEGTTDPIWKGFRLHGGAGEPEMYIADGVLVHHNTSDQNPGYDSASCPIIDTDSTVLQGGNWYMLKFDVKAAVARQMTVRIGLAAEAPIWLENFAGANNYPLSVSTEFETKYVVFYVHANASADGYTGISCELKNGGAFDWNAEKEIGNTFYFDNLQFYLLSNENAAPTLTINKELPTTFGKGQEKPDLTQYVTAYDREDAANITITAAHITESVNMAAAGTYDVVYKVADSEGKEATITLQIKVLEQADTTAPVLAEAADLVKVYDQFAAAPDITKFITATDDTDGAITITMDMIETTANLNVAGTYDIVYTVKDTSGNVATKTITITVNDKEGPKVVGKDLKTYVGTALSAADIIDNFTATDNVDGAITLTEAMVKGLDQVKFNVPGEYQVIIEVTDAAGNKTEQPVNISVREKGNTKVVADEVILDLAPIAPTVQESCVVTEAEGVYKIEIDSIGGWASANKMKFTPNVFVQGETYVLRITAKADKARSIQFNIGEAMDGSTTNVWMEKYPLAEEGSDIIALTTDYQTFDVVFTVQNEKFEWGPTIEFCVGPVAGACEKGNNIYFTELALYSVKEIGDVNLLHATIDPQHHEAGEGLVISKSTTSGQWDWIAFKPEATELEGYTKIIAKVCGPEGGVLLFKPNDLQPKETRYTMTGQWQEIEHVLDFTLDASKQALVLMPDADVVGSGKYYLIASLELQGEGKDPINLIDATISKADACTAQKALTLLKPTDNSEQYDCAKFKVSDDLTGYAGVKYAVIGTSGTTATLKPNDNGNYQRGINLDGTLQEGIIDLTGMTYKTSASAMILFVDLQVTGTGNPVFILEMSYIVEKPGEPEPENPGHVEPIAVNQSSASFASWEGLTTVTFTGLPATNSGSNGWARWDFDSVADKGFTDVVVQFRATPGLRICAKIDASTTPGNNAYDSISGNKTTLVAGEDGLVTFTWNLAEFAEAAQAAGKAFAVENIRKCVVFPSSGLEGEAALTTGSIELISIDFVKAEEVYVPVYPEAVEGVDLTAAAITPNGMQVQRQIRMMKNGGGQWNWVGLLYDGDLTGYTKMVAEVTGPAGAAFTFKVNDTVEKGVTTTGEALEVNFDLPEGFAWDASKKAMIMFPDFNIPGLGNEFTLTKLELQGADKDPIDLLVCNIVVDANVKACRDLVITKPTSNTGAWDCAILRLGEDFAGFGSISYTIRGTDGEKLLLKLNDQQEAWVTLNGKAQSGVAEFTGTYDKTKGALVLFPNAGEIGTGNKVVISQLVAVGGTAADTTAPVITVAPAVQEALASAEFIEGQDASALFAQLLAGISATDDVDGAITVTQEMVNLGGLTLNQLVAGDYTVTVTVKDAAGNEGKLELPIHVAPYPYTKHSLNVSGMQAATLKEDTAFADFFTVLATNDKTVVVEANSKNAGSLSFTNRMKLGGKSTPTARAIKFTTKSSSVKVTVYAYSSSSSENRNVHIFGEDGVAVATKLAYGAGEITILEAVLDKPGTYFIGGLEAAINIYGVVVEEGYTAPAAPANVDLLADMPTPNADYKSPNWKVEKYTTDWTVQTDVQMRARKSSAGAVVTNMANGYGMTMRFTYGTGSSLGLANTLSFKMGNYWSDKAEMSIKIKLVTVDDKEIYVLGSSSEFYAFHTTTDVEDFNLHFDAAEIKQVVFVTKSALQKSTYLYVGSLHLTYELSSQEHPLTVEEALDLAARMGRSSSSTYVDVQEVWIKGYIVNAGEDKGTYVQNAKIASTLNGKPVLAIYTASKGTGIANVYVNDEVLVHAYLMNYGGTLQIATTKVDGESLYSVIDACKAGTSTISVSQDSSEHATVKEISAESGVNGSTFTFKVDVANGHELVSVKVNGVDVEAVEGVYTATIGGPTQIVVETKEEGAVEPEKVADFSFASASTGTISTKTADKLEWVQGDVTFIVNKDNSSTACNSNSGEPYVNPLRVYGKQSIEVHYNGLIKVVFNANSNDYATALKNSTFPEGATVTVNAKVVTVVFATPVDLLKISNLSAQVRINSFEVYALPNGQTSSPAAFQVTNLQAEGDARNHIEGAGAWIWIDPTSIGLTAENMAQFSATATCESINVVEASFSDYSASAVRCYVKLASAPAADATTTIHLTITNGDASYQGQVSFLGNELQ